MIQIERELRERTDVDNLIELKISSTDEGRQAVSKIEKSMGELINEMREKDMDNETSKAYSDVRYDLKTARHNIQYQMMKIVKDRR